MREHNFYVGTRAGAIHLQIESIHKRDLIWTNRELQIDSMDLYWIANCELMTEISYQGIVNHILIDSLEMNCRINWWFDFDSHWDTFCCVTKCEPGAKKLARNWLSTIVALSLTHIKAPIYSPLSHVELKIVSTFYYHRAHRENSWIAMAVADASHTRGNRILQQGILTCSEKIREGEMVK